MTAQPTPLADFEPSVYIFIDKAMPMLVWVELILFSKKISGFEVWPVTHTTCCGPLKYLGVYL